MRLYTINLPTGKRLDLSLVKRRKPNKEPLLPKLRKVVDVRKGSKVSRYFRHVFEHVSIKKILGTNLAVLVLVNSFVTQPTQTDTNEHDTTAQATIVLTTERTVQYPLEKVIINQGYQFFHPGLDLEGITGDKIKPIKKGVVEAVSHSKYAYGNAIIVRHDNNLSSLYAHLSKIYVSEGQSVSTNDYLGEIGSTGRSSGDHLHLEIRESGIPVNPNTILPLD